MSDVAVCASIHSGFTHGVDSLAVELIDIPIERKTGSQSVYLYMDHPLP